ncbi:MAG: glycosyltransferase family 2 protein [Planctomycetota bacterium]
MLLSVVIPVYNEAKTVEELVERVQEAPFDKELIMVDDGSKDGTRDILRQIEAANDNVRVIFHEANAGKGAALRTGFEHVRGDIVLIQDADLEYNPSEYPALIRPIIDGRADVVYGSRFLGEVHRVHLFWHYAGNKFLTLLSNMMTNLNLTDMETCYKVFRVEVLRSIENLQQNRFGFEPEITAKISRGRWRIYEVPITYQGRDYAEGKKIGWRDGFSAIWCILKYGLSR